MPTQTPAFFVVADWLAGNPARKIEELKKMFGRSKTSSYSPYHKNRFDWRKLGVLIPANPLAILAVFKSLRHRNFLIYFLGLGVSMNGAWIQQLAMGWLVYSMTNSVFMLSLSVFLSQIPTLFLTPFGGVVSDRFDRRKIIIFTQMAMMLQSSILAALTLSGLITMPIILLLCLWQGIAISFDAPARQSFYVVLVPKSDLSNAIAMNSTIINATRFIGGNRRIMVAELGEGMCFLANALSYLAILLSLAMIKIPHKKSTFSIKNALGDIREGIVYTANSLPIRSLLMLLVVVSFFGIPFQLLMPAFAKGVLGGNSELLGTLMSFVGSGTLCAALYLAARKSVLGLGRVIIISSAVFGASLMAISFVRFMPLIYFLCFLLGFVMISVAASTNTMLQALVDDEKRGRVMSIFSMIFFGIPPLGSLGAGLFSNFVPLPAIVSQAAQCALSEGLRLNILGRKSRPVPATYTRRNRYGGNRQRSPVFKQ